MKKFFFNLEAILTLRLREEQEALGNWAKAAQAQAHAEQVHQAAVLEYQAAQESLTEERAGSFHPGDHQIHLAALEHQKVVCEQLKARADAAAEFTRVKHEEAMSARMKHEVLSRLKHNRKTAYEQALVASEEAAVSDLVIARHGTRRNRE
jgi:hypothetical protein